MTLAGSRRFGPRLLLAIFVLGGLGLPVLDGVVFHTGRQAPTTIAHFDPLGGCGGHAEHCQLATSASEERSVILRPAPAPVGGIIRAFSGPAPVTVIPSAIRDFLQPTRAPPVSAS